MRNCENQRMSIQNNRILDEPGRVLLSILYFYFILFYQIGIEISLILCQILDGNTAVFGVFNNDGETDNKTL